MAIESFVDTLDLARDDRLRALRLPPDPALRPDARRRPRIARGGGGRPAAA